MEDITAIEYRLTAIEETLKELKDVLIKTALQQRDIEDLKHRNDEFDKRIKILELQPLKEKSNRWEFVINTIFKIIVTGLSFYFLNKIGIPLK